MNLSSTTPSSIAAPILLQLLILATSYYTLTIPVLIAAQDDGASTIAQHNGATTMKTKKKYKFDEDIKVKYKISNPSSTTYIALYKQSARLNYGEESFWMSLCDDGNQDSYPCTDTAPTIRGEVVFSVTDPSSKGGDGTNWPPPMDAYRACLLDRDLETNKVTKLKCTTFKVKDLKSTVLVKSSLTTKKKYNEGETIVINFSMKQKNHAVRNQVIGLYKWRKPTAPINNDPSTWVYAGCDNQEGDQNQSNYCSVKNKSGNVNINDPSLKKGRYYACLIFDNNKPYNNVKCSKKFNIEEVKTSNPTSSPTSNIPSSLPSSQPSSVPSILPSMEPSSSPSSLPSNIPSSVPSSVPSSIPSNIPSSSPSTVPSVAPSKVPSSVPSSAPSFMPSQLPSLFPSSTPTETSPSPVNDHMLNIYKFFIAYRDPRNGMWCDNLAFTNSGVCGDSGSWVYDFYSAASTGWGLISDAVFTELGLLSYQEGYDRANQTMTNVYQHWPRDPVHGFYNHFTNFGYTAMGEYSTIDTSILIIGCEFAGNYFMKENDNSLRTLANDIFKDVDFPSAIGTDLYPAMYATVSSDGIMTGRYISPYNEYYILAYLAQQWEEIHSTKDEVNWHAGKYFETYFSFTGKPDGNHWQPKTLVYKGQYEVLSDQNAFVSSFIPQFCWYAVRSFRTNPYYVQMMQNWLLSEKAYWSDLDGRYNSQDNPMYTRGINVTGRVYGSGAGDCPQAGYCVSKIGSAQSTDDTYSAAIMAGFLGGITAGPLHDEIRKDVEWLYDNDVCTYVKVYADGSSSKVLWRCSVSPSFSDWQANRPTSVDFSTMVFGYSTNFLRPDFWDLYSHATPSLGRY